MGPKLEMAWNDKQLAEVVTPGRNAYVRAKDDKGQS